jgi:hypothetical protein
MGAVSVGNEMYILSKPVMSAKTYLTEPHHVKSKVGPVLTN